MSTCVTCLKPGAKLRPASKRTVRAVRRSAGAMNWCGGKVAAIVQCDEYWFDWLDFAAAASNSTQLPAPPAEITVDISGWTNIIA